VASPPFVRWGPSTRRDLATSTRYGGLGRPVDGYPSPRREICAGSLDRDALEYARESATLSSAEVCAGLCADGPLRGVIACVRAGWSSSVARRAHNPEDAGSNPAPATVGPVPHAGSNPAPADDGACARSGVPEAAITGGDVPQGIAGGRAHHSHARHAGVVASRSRPLPPSSRSAPCHFPISSTP
jgi:hypothetical protein